MKRLTASFLLLALISILTDESAYAWGSKGHQIVAYIAEAHLTDSSKEKIKKLLQKGGVTQT